MPNNVNRVYTFRPAMAIYPELKRQKLALANGDIIVECCDRGCKVDLNNPDCFQDDMSIREFDIHGTCQHCQNDFYNHNPEVTND